MVPSPTLSKAAPETVTVAPKAMIVGFLATLLTASIIGTTVWR